MRNIAVTTNKGALSETSQASRAKVDRGSLWLQCDGIPESLISGITFENVTVHGSSEQECTECKIDADALSEPKPQC